MAKNHHKKPFSWAGWIGDTDNDDNKQEKQQVDGLGYLCCDMFVCVCVCLLGDGQAFSREAAEREARE